MSVSSNNICDYLEIKKQTLDVYLIAVPTFRPPATEDNGVDGNALLTLPLGVNDGTLTRRGTEAGIGMGTRSLASFIQRGKNSLFQL